MRLYTRRLRGADLRAPADLLVITDLPELMRWLHGQMVAAGIEVRLMQSFTDASRLRDGWRIDGPGSARWLVGAEGAKSRVAAACGPGRVEALVHCIEYDLNAAVLADPDALHCVVDKRRAPRIIGWAVQHPTGVQAGLAFRHDAPRHGLPDIAGWMRELAITLGLQADALPTSTLAGLMPCGSAVARRSAPGVILVGDVAGIVSPLNVGAINSAWQDGWHVGTTIVAYASKKVRRQNAWRTKADPSAASSARLSITGSPTIPLTCCCRAHQGIRWPGKKAHFVGEDHRCAIQAGATLSTR